MLPHRQSHEAPRGFALIISMTLMAFLLLLIVGLTALTTLETHSATQARMKAEAQQNALTAMQIALGELQRFAGPDQRVTARADLQNGSAAANPLWTGVYGSSIAADYNEVPAEIAKDLTDTTKVDTNGSPAKLLSWLVSGNESIAFNAESDVGKSGEILSPPANIPYDPSGYIANLDKKTLANATNLTIQGSGGDQPARILVGPGSVGDASAESSSDDADAVLKDYVAAPAIELYNAQGGVTGRYAWWVGDEGVKARAALPIATEDEDKLNAFVNATRTAVELMSIAPSGTAQLDGVNIDAAYNPLAENLTQVESRTDLNLVSTDPDKFDQYLKHRFHDVTAHSQSVLSDTYAGGLKRDLSILLDENYTVTDDDPTADANRMWAFDPITDRGWSGANGGLKTRPGYNIPSWRHLRSFYQTRVPTTGADAMKMTPILPANDKQDDNGEEFPDHVGLAPVITYYSLGFSMQPDAEPAPGVGINLQLYPLVVIWNPYNFTIKAPPEAADGFGNYEVGLYLRYGVEADLMVLKAGGWKKLSSFDFIRSLDGNWDSLEYIRFRLNCPDIPPGQSLIFTLPPSGSGTKSKSGDLYTQKNVLENTDPEPGSYVKLPFTYNHLDGGKKGAPVKIQAGEEDALYELLAPTGNAAGASFKDGASGFAYMYLGEPINYASFSPGDQHNAQNPGYFRNRWYNAHQRITWSGIKVAGGDAPIPPQQLTYFPDQAPPEFVVIAEALFSDHDSLTTSNNVDKFPTRWIAQGNMRAQRTNHTRRDPSNNPLFFATAGTPDGQTRWQYFQPSPGAARTSSGTGLNWVNGSPVDAVLFEFPYEGQPLQSIGQLQHANLSLIGDYPSYPIGNSIADYHMPDTGIAPGQGKELVRTDFTQQGEKRELTYEQTAYYDISFLLNRTLWDQYYFSTISPLTDVTEDLANPRFVKYNPTALSNSDPDANAAGLMINGGFNINSTSEQAWRAVLGGIKELQYDPQNSDIATSNSLRAAFPRFSRPSSGDATSDVWQGYRTLDEKQIAQLAHNIVLEIKNRGPFVSVADFVNRRLVDNKATVTPPSASYVHEHFNGTIQAAIQRTPESTLNAYPANDGSESFWVDDSKLNPTYTSDQNYFKNHTYDEQMLKRAALDEERPASNLSTFAPKYLTQGDVLSTIGASLTARSDTFVVRAYGEVVNPLNPSEVRAQAWCEAIVQRYPEYIDESLNAPGDTPTANTINDLFGRKFQIIDFRWLNADEV